MPQTIMLVKRQITINLSILDFKYDKGLIVPEKGKAINLSILDFK